MLNAPSKRARMGHLALLCGIGAGLAWGTSGCGDDSGTGAFESQAGTSRGTESGSSTANAPNSDSQSDAASAAGSSGQANSTGEPPEILLDVAAPKGDLGPCGCELAYIWIANAQEGTVSKINVRTMEEEGRYITRPDGAGNPSRTSVNLAGDVAVANRHGGLTKFYAEQSDCIETNGMPGIQTSTGAGDVLPWDIEECRAWYTEFPTTNQRPVAWIAGQVTPGTCNSTDQKVWTVTSATPGFAPGIGGFGGVIAYLVDGLSGDIDLEVQIDEFDGFQLGAYGGAVDAAGNLFFSPMGAVAIGPQLARVDIETLEVSVWPLPAGVASYGITVDHNGMVWLSSTSFVSGAARFDPVTETWAMAAGFVSAGGLAEGPDNQMWVSTDNGAVAVDIDTLEIGTVFTTNMGGGIKGISVDVDGFVWAVGDIAFKVDPATGTVADFYNGLTNPYTYSDMTGYALGNVTCPPAG